MRSDALHPGLGKRARSQIGAHNPDVLLADRAAAVRDGRSVLSFVEHQRRTRWNTGYLEMLSAAGHTFSGDCGRALAVGKGALGMASRTDDALIWNERALQLARIDAWCGAEEDAVALLRELSSSRPAWDPVRSHAIRSLRFHSRGSRRFGH